jgi:hypothetical protein
MKSPKLKTAKTSNVKRSDQKDDTGPSVVETSANSEASPEIPPPAIPTADPAAVSEITTAMLSKVRRAFRKAGKEGSEAEQEEFAVQLIAAGVPILSRSSGRIAKVLKAEETLEDLKISKSRKPKMTKIL